MSGKLKNNISITRKFGRVEYRFCNKLHRNDGPAVVDITHIETIFEGKPLRCDDINSVFVKRPVPEMDYIFTYDDTGSPGLIKIQTGTDESEYVTIREWWDHGKRHRIDGPAITIVMKSYNEWWINGKQITEDEFNDKKYLAHLLVTG